MVATTDRLTEDQAGTVAAVESGIDLIQDLTPVGAPDWSAIGIEHVAPELYPRLVDSQPYQTPEMWPEAEGRPSKQHSRTPVLR